MTAGAGLAPGGSLGKFRLLGRLGRGGMGEVWLAETETNDRVAIKVLGVRAALRDDGGRRFERERRLLDRVRHDNVVAVLGALEHDEAADLTFFPMELVLGKSLAELLAEHGRYPIRDAVTILGEVATALAAAHEAGVVHRDVKPGNVLIDREGRARLTDFGLARALDESRFTRTAEALGTPAYMAPEQASGDEAGPAADLYALGALAWELLAGRPPFQAENALALLRLHIDATPEPIAERRAGLPDELATLVDELLRKRPDDRPESAAAVRDRLAAIESALPEDADDDETGAFRRTVRAAVARQTDAIAQLAATAALPTRGETEAPAAPRSAAPIIVLLAATAIGGFVLTWGPWRGGGPPGPAAGASGSEAPSERRIRLVLTDDRVFEGTLVRYADPPEGGFVVKMPDDSEQTFRQAEIAEVTFPGR